MISMSIDTFCIVMILAFMTGITLGGICLALLFRLAEEGE